MEEIIINPIITEKSMDDAAKGKFTFKVKKDANKNVIKEAIEKKFKVNVTGVWTSVIKSKRVRTGKRRIEVSRFPFKKATVLLKTGQKIDLFEAGGA
ncbi:MAG: 50S ribosomal protein L23 [bacterium]|nr:50S ribosomal protein L23 [bacterium]